MAVPKTNCKSGCGVTKGVDRDRWVISNIAVRVNVGTASLRCVLTDIFDLFLNTCLCNFLN